MLNIKKTVGLMGVNCYIIGSNTDAIIVDPGSDAESILETLKKNDITAKYIVLTHCHFDHIMAVEKLMKNTSIKLIACQSEKDNLLDPSINYTDRYSRKPIVLSADLYVCQGDIIKSGDFEFRVLETPGHTSGSMCLYCEKESVLISGDTLFYESIGRCDLATGNGKMLINSIKEKLFSLPDETAVLPGHGENTTIGYEKKNNPYIF